MLDRGCRNDRRGLDWNCLLLYVNRSSDYIQFPASGNHTTSDFTSVGHENTTDAWLAIVVKRKWCDEQIRDLVHIHVDCPICFWGDYLCANAEIVHLQCISSQNLDILRLHFDQSAVRRRVDPASSRMRRCSRAVFMMASPRSDDQQPACKRERTR